MPRRAIQALPKFVSAIILAHLVLNVQAGLIKRREINADPGFPVANATSDPAIVRGVESEVGVPNIALSESPSVIKTTRLQPQSTAFNGHPQLNDEGKRDDLPGQSQTTESVIHNRINDGLDSFESGMEKDGASNLETTEENLLEIENFNIAVKTAVSNATTDGVNKMEVGRSMSHSDEIYDEDTESDVGSDPRHKLDAIKSTKGAETMKDIDLVVPATTTAKSIPNGHALFVTTDANIPATQPSNVQFVKTVFALPVTTAPKSNPVSVLQSNEESNEVRLHAPNNPFIGNSSSEKRGKFINDNSTNAHQLNLPNSAEVWSLAAMKAVPPNATVIESTTRKPFVDDLASNSEKNLLDWSQIMTSNLDAKNKEEIVAKVAVNTSDHANTYVHEEEKRENNDQFSTTPRIIDNQSNIEAYNGKILDSKANTAEDTVKLIDNKSNMTEHHVEQLIDSKSNETEPRRKVVDNKSNTTQEFEKIMDSKPNTTEQHGQIIDSKSNITEQHGKLIDGKSNITEQHEQVIDSRSNMTEQHGQLIDSKSNMTEQHGQVIDGRANMTEQHGQLIVSKSNMMDQQGQLIDNQSNLNAGSKKLNESELHGESNESKQDGSDKKADEKLNDRPITARKEIDRPNDTIALDKHGVQYSNTTLSPPKSSENLDNRTEILLRSTLDSTDKANEPVTASSNFSIPALYGENEVLSHTTPHPAVPLNTEVSGHTKIQETTVAPVPLSVPRVTLTTTIPTVVDKNNETLSADKHQEVGDMTNPAAKATPLESERTTTFATVAAFHEFETNIAHPAKAADETLPQIPVATTTQATVETMRPIGTTTTERATPAPHLNVSSNSSSDRATLNPNKNKSDVGNEGDDDVHASNDEQRVATSSSEPKTVSTLEASNANRSAIVERGSNPANSDQKYEGGIDLGKPTVPAILATNSTGIGVPTTEVVPIDNEIHLVNANTGNQEIVSSTIKTHLPIKGEDNETGTGEPTTATSASSANELLINITTTKATTTTQASDRGGDWITTPATAAERKDEAETTTLETPVVDTKPTEKVKAATSRETESSIETNAIDPFDKQAPTTSTAKATVAKSNTELPLKENAANDLEETDKEEGPIENEDKFALGTTPGTPKMNSTTLTVTTPSTTSTTETLAISLLDDSTSSTSTSTTTTSTTSTTTSTTSTTGTTTAVPAIIEEVTEAATTTTTPIPSTPALDSTESADSTHVPVTVSSAPPLPKIITPSSATMLPTTHLTTSETTTHVPPLIAGAGNIHPNSAGGHETDVNVIIAISVSVIGVVALILLVAFLYLMRKRQKQMSYGQRCRPVSLDAYSLDNVSVLDSVRRKGALRASKRSYGNAAFDDPSLRHNVLTATELGKFVERRSSIFEEFRDVPQITTRADEVPPGCEDKNRYANVIPLPETRVVLQQQNDDDKTEYINANYVRGPKDAPNYYIACQAPLEITVADFWRMIWEQQSRVIIQATDLIENGIEKCAEYLPPSVTLDNHTTYGDFQVTLRNREVKDKYAISTLMLKNTIEDVSRELTHYWYKWPEAGVPVEEAPIIAMLLEARSSLKSYAVEQANELKEKVSTPTLKVDEIKNSDSEPTSPSKGSPEKKEESSVSSNGNGEINGNVDKNLRISAKSQGPLTIHCSPGTGRTGTIIACDMAIRSLENPKRTVDIPQIVYYVRRGRASAVQTKEQYEFIYKVANMYATKITNLSNDN